MSKRNKSRGKNNKSKSNYQDDESFEYKPRKSRKNKQQSQSQEQSEQNQNQKLKNQSFDKNEKNASQDMQQKDKPSKKKDRSSKTLYIKLLKEIDLTKEDAERMKKQRDKEAVKMVELAQSRNQKNRDKHNKQQKQSEPQSQENFRKKDKKQKKIEDKIKQKQNKKQESGSDEKNQSLLNQEQISKAQQIENPDKNNLPENKKLQVDQSVFKDMQKKLRQFQKIINKQQKQIQNLKQFKKQIKQNNSNQKTSSSSNQYINSNNNISEKRIQRIERKLDSVIQLSFWTGCIRAYWQNLKKSSNDIDICQGRVITRVSNKESGLQFCLKKQPLPINQRVAFTCKLKHLIKSYKVTNHGLFIGVKFVQSEQILKKQEKQQKQRLQKGIKQENQNQEDKEEKIHTNKDKQKQKDITQFFNQDSNGYKIKEQHKQNYDNHEANHSKIKSKQKISQKMAVNYVEEQQGFNSNTNNHVNNKDKQNKPKVITSNNQNNQQLVDPNLKDVIAYNIIGQINFLQKTLQATKSCKQDDIINVIIQKGKFIAWYDCYTEIGSVQIPRQLLRGKAMMGFIGFWNKGDSVKLSSLVQ